MGKWVKDSISSPYAYKLRENAVIQLQDGLTIKRNIYSHYVSNNNPVYCRIQGKTVFLSAWNYNQENEYFTISLIGGTY